MKTLRSKVYTSISIMILINMTVGSWSIIEILSWFGISIPLIAGIIAGAIVGELSIPIAIIGLFIR